MTPNKSCVTCERYRDTTTMGVHPCALDAKYTYDPVIGDMVEKTINNCENQRATKTGWFERLYRQLTGDTRKCGPEGRYWRERPSFIPPGKVLLPGSAHVTEE